MCVPNCSFSMSSSDESTADCDETCVFCLIANGQDECTELLQKNKELVCFRDIFPVAPHHYLVIPRQHILNCLSLVKKHVSLVENMVEMGKAALRANGITDMTDIRLGFHLPPYNSVNHLHLHVLAPASQIDENMLFKFIPGSKRFVTEDVARQVLSRSSNLVSLAGQQQKNDDKLRRII